MIATLQRKRSSTICRIPSQIHCLLAIEWRTSGIAVLAFERSNGGWKITHESIRPWLSEVPAKGNAERALELQRFLKELRLDVDPAATAITFTLDPAFVISKRFSLPKMNDDLLHDAVTLELESRGLDVEKYANDFIVHDLPLDGRLVVSAASAPSELIEQCRAIAQFLGFSLMGIGLGEFGIAAGTPPQLGKTNESLSLHLLADQELLQLLLTADNQPLADFRIPYPEQPDMVSKIVSASLQRLIQSLPFPIDNVEVWDLTVVGQRADEMTSALQSNVLKLHDADIVEPPSSAWRAWGSVQGLLTHQATFDFNRPKRGRNHDQMARAKMRRSLLAVACVLVMAAYGVKTYHQYLDSQLSTKRALLNRQDLFIEENRPLVDAAVQLVNWQSLPVRWVNELPRILKQLPDHERAFLTNLHIDQGNEMGGEVRLEGVARELEDALGITQRLLDNGFELQPHRIENNEADPHYRIRFTVTVKLNSPDSPADDEGARNVTLRNVTLRNVALSGTEETK